MISEKGRLGDTIYGKGRRGLFWHRHAKLHGDGVGWEHLH